MTDIFIIPKIKVLSALSYLILSGLTAAFIVYAPFYLNLVLIFSFVFGAIITYTFTRGSKYFNENFIPPFITIMLAIFMVSQNIIEITGNNYIDEMLFIPFSLCAIISGLSGRTFVVSKRLKKICFLLTMFILSGGISTVLNQVPIPVAINGGLLICKPIIIFAMFFFFSFTETSKQKLYVNIERFFITFSIIALFWMLFFEILLSYNPIQGISIKPDSFHGLSAYRSFFRHPGAYSAMMFIGSIFFFSLYLNKRQKKDLILLVVTTLGLLSSLKAKTIILLPISCGIIYALYAFQKNKHKYTNFASKLSLGIIIGFALISTGFYFTKDKLLFYSTTENVRKEILVTSFQVSNENLGLGAGFGRYGSAVSTRYYSPLYYKYGLYTLYGSSVKKSNFITDQWWAWYIGESGIIGMLFFLSGLFIVCLELSEISRRNQLKNQNLSILSYTALGGLIYGIGSGFAAASLSSPPASYFIMGLSALAMNRHKNTPIFN